MSNIVSSLLISGVSPLAVGGTGASVKLFPPPANTLKSKRGYVFVPGNNQANGQRLIVRASGNYRSSMPVRIGLYGVMPDSKLPFILCSEVFQGDSNNTAPWMLSAELCGDTGSSIMQGTYSIQVLQENRGVIAPLRNVDFSLDEPLALAIGITFSSSDTKNLSHMYQFSLHQ